ncbi:hypothetical protein [Rubellicoccus peritrichatus]|uniref:Glycoside hydrolase family 42 N-terminal domain-containing protein n=1 Tax=Rubellicoccus peritrichatus TaxID=3080537 RepID=A0AAQ3QVL3_9BACT|nr:hypothetical protein [Puniceicoccus sp. CR14]WOO41025.1 hypothetical protein RZN69_20590 [Puniceicoccus sp. CR14]
MHHWKLTLLSLVVSSLSLTAQDISINSKGIINTGGVSWETFYQNAKWQPNPQNKRLQLDGKASISGPWTGDFKNSTNEAVFRYTQNVIRPSAHELNIHCKVTAVQPFVANTLSFAASLPTKAYSGRTLKIDGQELILPELSDDNQLLFTKKARHVSLPISGGTLDVNGDFHVMVVDNRKYGGTDFALRLCYQPFKGEISESTFEAKMTLKPFEQQTISLQSIINRSFVDEVAHDGKGGWTDQGPDNDLSAFTHDAQIAGDVTFHIDPRGAVVLSKKPTRSNLATVQINAPETSFQPAYLYLLHSSAYTWGKVGVIKVSYADGSEEIIDVKSGKDVGNWWNPVALPNGAIAWTGSNQAANIGLYLSRFALQSKPVNTIEFSAVNDPVWMIVGATFSDAEISLPNPTSFIVRANKDWAPIELPLTIEPGSALDFSAWTEAPAGKHGHVITTPDGHFAFADNPDKSVRFWGTNTNFEANFLNKEQSKALAKRFRQMGYNAARIHHYDVLLANGWNSESYGLDAEKLDRLDYFFFCLKNEGLYVSTDLFTIRRIHEPAVAAIDGYHAGVFKALIPIMPEAMNDWKRFARDFLTHKNPYTGLTWAEDPALFSICPVNEDTIWAAINSNSEVRELWEKKFEAWLLQSDRHTTSEASRTAAFNEFLAERQIASDTEMKRFLRDELNCKALITGNNWKSYRAQAPIRAEFEYVDNHGYWDHPNFPKRPWVYPYSHSQRSATQDRAEIPRRIFLTRMKDKPFTVTEFNFVYPNQFRSEGGPLVGSFAGLQDWDGLFRFSWAHNSRVATSQQAPEGFDIANDPIGLLSEHIIGMFWRRGDMPVFEEEAVYVLGPGEAFAGEKVTQQPRKFDENATMLGLTKRISTSYQSDVESQSLNHEFHSEEPRDRYESSIDDSRFILETAGNFLAETKESKALVIQSRSLDENFVSGVTGGPATIFIGAIDDKPLAASDRVLILHLTNALPSGATFGEKGMYSILGRGKLPILIQRGSANITVPKANLNSDTKLYALDLTGQRVAEIPFEREAGSITFTAQTIAPDRRTTLAYELTQ